MNKQLTVAPQLSAQSIETVLLKGDLAQLSPEQRLGYYQKVCESVGVNHLTKPFEYITLNSKLVLYAKRDATDQLRKIHNVSIEIVAREKIGDIYVVTARAKLPSGRTDESTGAVSLNVSKGDALANLFMKAETKAKRRVTLSICGLGFLDETEVETITESKINVEAPKLSSNDNSPASVSPETNSDYAIDFGKKYIGKRLSEIPLQDLKNYRLWLESTVTETGKPMSPKAERFMAELEKFLTEDDIPF
jgi:hypothetical protein